MPDPALVQLDGDQSVIVERSFTAPRTSVWAAFTNPEVLGQWLLGPPGWDMLECSIDLCVGGGYRWRWRHGDTGEEFGFTGTYSEVQIGARLVDTQSFDQGTHALPLAHALPLGGAMQNSVVFEDDGNGTRVVTCIRYPDVATRDMVMGQGMATGMETSYARLDHVLATSGAALPKETGAALPKEKRPGAAKRRGIL